MSNVLFGYSSTSCFYDDYDFRAEFRITDKGSLILEVYNRAGTYDFKQKIMLSKSIVAKLKEVLCKYQSRIATFPRGKDYPLVLDGSCQQFILLGKKISTLNIRKSSPIVLNDLKELYGQEEYADALLQNELLEIVEKIHQILAPYGMKIRTWPRFECDWPPLKEITDYINSLTQKINDQKITDIQTEEMTVTD